MNHGVEHLGRGDDYFAHLRAEFDDVLLNCRDILRRNLNAEVAARHHDAVRRPEDFLDVLHALHGLNLCDNLHLAALCIKNFANRADIIRCSREGGSDVVKTELAAELDIASVLLGDKGHGEIRPRDVDTLVVRDLAAVHNRAVNLRAVDFIDPKFNQAVVNQDAAARLDILREIRICHRNNRVVTEQLPRGQGELRIF